MNTKTTESIVRWSGTWSLTSLWRTVVKQRTWNIRITNHLEISQKTPKCWRFKSSLWQGDLCGRKIAHTETICRIQRRVLTFCTVCKQEQSNISNSQEGTLTILTSEVPPSNKGTSGSWLALRASYRDPMTSCPPELLPFLCSGHGREISKFTLHLLLFVPCMLSCNFLPNAASVGRFWQPHFL